MVVKDRDKEPDDKREPFYGAPILGLLLTFVFIIMVFAAFVAA